MKSEASIVLSSGWRRVVIGAGAIGLVLACISAGHAGPGGLVSTNVSMDDQVVAALRNVNSNDLGPDSQVIFNWIAHRKEIIQSLITIFHDPQSTVYTKSCAANYLGEMRASEAADILAAQITVNPPGAMAEAEFHVVPYGEGLPVMHALIRIGSPAIPAVIRNLAESDDEQVRGCSYMVLKTVEGDGDVVQLRLQKALDAQSDPRKKALLQSALKSLTNTDSQFKIRL